jgi:hypothetical protein
MTRVEQAIISFGVNYSSGFGHLHFMKATHGQGLGHVTPAHGRLNRGWVASGDVAFFLSPDSFNYPAGAVDSLFIGCDQGDARRPSATLVQFNKEPGPRRGWRRTVNADCFNNVYSEYVAGNLAGFERDRFFVLSEGRECVLPVRVELRTVCCCSATSIYLKRPARIYDELCSSDFLSPSRTRWSKEPKTNIVLQVEQANAN